MDEIREVVRKVKDEIKLGGELENGGSKPEE